MKRFLEAKEKVKYLLCHTFSMKRSDKRRAVKRKQRMQRVLHKQYRGAGKPRASKPKTFVMSPFRIESKGEIKRKRPLYEELKKMARKAMAIKHGKAGLPEVLQVLGVATKRPYGLVLDVVQLPLMATDPVVGPFFRTLFNFYRAGNPAASRAAHLESIQLVKQLRGLGFKVAIQHTREKERKSFVRAAQRAGAVKIRENPDALKGLGTTWARDQWIKIAGKREKPKTDMRSMLFGPEHHFGEGGSMIQVGPKEFAVIESLSQDPRLRHYSRLGYRFQLLPQATVFDRPLTDFFGTKIYTMTPHIDVAIGGIPEKKIAAVDPNYFGDHKPSIQSMQRNLGVKLVFVPKAEADRHPANFLPLGQGRVLVDSGAPKFIQELKKAGIETIPTAVPLNALASMKGGLHCLFNEY